MGRCVICNFEVESFEGLDSCPNCGTTYAPVFFVDDINIAINWQELRGLVMWAEFWANAHKESEDMLRFVYNQAERLEKQFPDRQRLTLYSEIEELRKVYDVEMHNIPEPPPKRLTLNDVLDEAQGIIK